MKLAREFIKPKKEKISVGMLSLGCPKTLVDSEVALGILQNKNYEIAESVTDCDVAIVNTCAFIHEARKESIEKILSLSALKEEGRIQKLVVMGCLAQKYHPALKRELPEVDAFVGTGDYPQIAEIIEETRKGRRVIEVGKPLYLYDYDAPRFSLTPPHYRYVKISEGCNHKCSFCIIPQLKGLHRSRRIEDVVKEVRDHASKGVREVILTGQDTSFYGRDFAQKFLLSDLLKSLNEIEDIAWIRLLYAYPLHLSDEILQAISESEKICKYVDVPLQHVSDRMLSSMRRGVDKVFVKNLVRKIRERIPGVAIRTTFIVGYPGETEQDFRELLEFIEESRFERMGVFTYSYEEFSHSGTLPDQLPEKVKEERLHKAMSLQQKISAENNRCWIGKTTPVLIEGIAEEKKRGFVGRTYMDAPDVDGLVYVKAPQDRLLKAGEIVDCRITHSYEYDLAGEAVS